MGGRKASALRTSSVSVRRGPVKAALLRGGRPRGGVLLTRIVRLIHNNLEIRLAFHWRFGIWLMHQLGILPKRTIRFHLPS